jgi:hypothetical protein
VGFLHDVAVPYDVARAQPRQARLAGAEEVAGPRSSRSRSAIANPSVVEAIVCSRSRASSVHGD